MELATIGGLVMALMTLVATVFLEGGSLSALWGPSAFVLIIGGTIGATIMSHPLEDVKRWPALIGQAFRAQKLDAGPVAEALIALAEKARRQGLLSLQDDPACQVHPLVNRGVNMVVDGMSGEAINEALSQEVAVREELDMGRAAMMDTAGGYAPTIGIIGTVFGLINVLSNLSDSESLGHSIAVAFLATFYGIASANLLFLPLGAKLKRQFAARRRMEEMIIFGITALQAGDHPRTIQEKLSVYMPAARGKGKEQAKGESAAVPAGAAARGAEAT